MHKLKSMKITKAEREKRDGPAKLADYPSDTYPYGLQIRLDDVALEKLEIESLPKTGRKVRVMAECTVTSTSEHKRSTGGKDDRNRSMELQIEKLSVNLEPGSAEEAMEDALEDS
jgi:hypothetical protein